jgi:hypothetical protein
MKAKVVFTLFKDSKKTKETVNLKGADKLDIHRKITGITNCRRSMGYKIMNCNITWVPERQFNSIVGCT